MHRLTLTASDNAAIRELVGRLSQEFPEVSDPELARRAGVLARALPPVLLQFLEDYRLREPAALCLVSGLAVDDSIIGATPEHWRAAPANTGTLPYEIFFLLCASVLGDVFGWATQQDGRLMHDVLPIAGHEHEEIGSNSLQHLSWHTEDSFHPCRGDYVALLCLRNPDLVATTACDAGDLDWSRLDVDTLLEPEFTQLPDNSHGAPEGGREVSGDDPALAALRARSVAMLTSWRRDPVRRPLVFGDRGRPYMALDPYHISTEGWSPRHRAAYEGLCAEIEKHLVGVTLRPGDCLFVDNFRAVHGRRSFRPRYDGSDRWLKRLNVTRNLRGSRAWRTAPEARIIY